MYLEPRTVDETFCLIAEFAGPGSVLVFDFAYASVIQGKRTQYGAAVADSAARAGEAWRFGIERGRVGEFLAGYGFGVTDEASPETLEQRYFTDRSGRLFLRRFGHLSRGHCYRTCANAQVSGRR